MSWSIGYDFKRKRDVGYGVPATCDHPGCGAEIDRGLSSVCGGMHEGGEHGCGLYFCQDHLRTAGQLREHEQLCSRCYRGKDSFEPTPDVLDWINHKLTDPSWAKWRAKNPDEVKQLKEKANGGG